MTVSLTRFLTLINITLSSIARHRLSVWSVRGMVAELSVHLYIPIRFRSRSTKGNAMAGPIPPVIYEHYQAWPQDRLAEEISDLLRQPNREQSVSGAALKAWMIHVSLSYLRPDVTVGDEATKESAARWIAFGLRYLLPLCANERRPVTGDRVLATMQTRPNLTG